METTDELENIWYVSATSEKGFSSDPNQAVRDLTGAPIISPGHVKNILEKQERRYQRSLDVQRKAVQRIWDLLLDLMEENLAEEDQERVWVLDGQEEILRKALAILEYGHEYKEDSEKALQRVYEMAQVRYDKESE